MRCIKEARCREAGVDCGPTCWRHPCHGKDCKTCEEYDACDCTEHERNESKKVGAQ